MTREQVVSEYFDSRDRLKEMKKKGISSDDESFKKEVHRCLQLRIAVHGIYGFTGGDTNGNI